MKHALRHYSEYLGYLFGIAVKAFFATYGALIALRVWGIV
jgi:hypothetical protein